MKVYRCSGGSFADYTNGCLFVGGKTEALKEAKAVSKAEPLQTVTVTEIELIAGKDGILACLNGEGFASSKETIATFEAGKAVQVASVAPDAPPALIAVPGLDLDGM